MKEGALCYLLDNRKILLIFKKRGIRSGKWNGPGGHLEAGESPVDCARREVEEETGMKALEISQAGLLSFYFDKTLKWKVHIFASQRFAGTLKETEETRPKWLLFEEIPYDEMWEDNRHWMPFLLQDKQFKGSFYFDSEGHKLLSHKLGSVV